MEDVLKTLKELKALDPNIRNIGYLISDESLALFRKELERAKRATGLIHEVEAQAYTTDPNDPEKVRYTVFITNADRSKVLLVCAVFPHIEVYENSATWHCSTQLNPDVTYQTSARVNELFKSVIKEIEL